MYRFFNRFEKSFSLGVCKVIEFASKCVAFWKNLHTWQKFYTTAIQWRSRQISTLTTSFSKSHHFHLYFFNIIMCDTSKQVDPCCSYFSFCVFISAAVNSVMGITRSTPVQSNLERKKLYSCVNSLSCKQ